MTELLLVYASILLVCVIASKLLYRFGVPTLLIFMVFGMLFGSDGIGGIYFNNYDFAYNLCSIGLVFIMFYGGFATSWKTAKPAAVQATVLSFFGTIITAVLTGLFCFWVFKLELLEGLLIGSVVASTDAASVFSILRSRKLSLKGQLAPILELESGSNDPFAFMLTVVILMLMGGSPHQPVVLILLEEIGFAVGIGAVLALSAAAVLRRIRFEIDGLYPIFVTAIAVLGYAFSDAVGGNGYLCVYITGIIIGNSRIIHKKSLGHFFDGISWLMQIMLFFTLGLLSFPSKMPPVIIPGLLVSVFVILVARPAAVFGTLSFFKVPLKQKLFVSWVGLRGAASVVFAIYAVMHAEGLKHDIFHIVFFVSLFSVLVQGTLLPAAARKLDLVEKEQTIFKTFTDYQEESLTQLVEYTVHENGPWAGKTLIEAEIPEEILVVMIRRGHDIIVPRGSTEINVEDVLVLSSNSPELFENLPL